MSFFGELARGLVNRLPDDQTSDLLQVAERMLAGSGGVDRFPENLKHSGPGTQLASWIDAYSNLRVPADQVRQALSNEQISSTVRAPGFDPAALPFVLRQLIPPAVDKASPNDVLPA